MAHVEKTRAIVEEGETFDGRIFPTEKAELGRPVNVRTDAVLQGSVYGETVGADDGAVIEGSVMASEAVEIDGGSIRGEIGTPGKILAEDGDLKGSVTGKRVTLEDTVVRGNVVGTEVILENCIVLGTVAAERRLEMQRSLAYTIRTQGDTVLSETTLVLPQAIVNGPIDLETPVQVAGLGLLEAETRDEAPEENQSTDGHLPEMTESDLYDREDQTYLTLAPRILNLEKTAERLTELEEAVMAVVNDATDDQDAATDVEAVLSVLGVEEHITNQLIH